MRRIILVGFCLAVSLPGLPVQANAAAVSPPAPAHAKGDPFESFNRANFTGTRSLQKLLRPFLALYRALTPGVIGKGIHNVLVNLKEPVVVLNDLLQLRVGRAGEAGARFAFNSTIGILGLIDVAGAAGNPHHDNGFGTTLGHYGVGPGPYLFLPLLGPTDIRDVIGSGADLAASPVRYVQFPYDVTINIGVLVFGGLDTFANSENQLDALIAESADPYASLRSAYLQNREAQIHGNSAPTVLPDLDELDTPAPPATPTSPTAPGPSADLPVPGPIQPAALDTAPAPAAASNDNTAPPSEDAALDAPIATAIL